MSARSSISSVPAGEYVPTADSRIVMRCRNWADFERFVALRGIDSRRPRVTYLEGVLELMSPSTTHERIKRHLARIIEAYLAKQKVRFGPFGSWLIKHPSMDAGVEPDECFSMGDLDKERPDLAVEVIWTSGGLNKLDVYARLRVPEVWFWKDDTLAFFALTDEAYEIRTNSALIPAFDRELAYDLMQIEAYSDLLEALDARVR